MSSFALQLTFAMNEAVRELVNILQWLTIKRGGLALLTRDECCGGVAVSCFNQVLHIPVVAAQEHDVDGIGVARYVDVHTNLNPWAACSVVNIVEESRRECTSFSNAGTNLERK